MTTSDQERRAGEYGTRYGFQILWDRRLGFGNDGTVWETDQRSAVKAFDRENNYIRERNCYQRLEEVGVERIGELMIPRLVGFDDDLLIVEMGVVFPPFLLDFGKSYLDHPPDYTPEVLADWESERRELFGDRWPQVQETLGWLRRYGIYYYDAKPGNLTLLADRQHDDARSQALPGNALPWRLSLLYVRASGVISRQEPAIHWVPRQSLGTRYWRSARSL